MEIKVTIFVCAALAVAGCSAPSQNVKISTIPPGASISVGQQYIGESPSDYYVSDVDAVGSLAIEAVNACYRTQTKRVQKTKDKFPDHVLLKLDPVANPPASCGMSSPKGSLATPGGNITIVK